MMGPFPVVRQAAPAGHLRLVIIFGSQGGPNDAGKPKPPESSVPNVRPLYRNSMFSAIENLYRQGYAG